jgi:lincosamide nucleotidyltransferase A/C/D/E
MNAADALAAIQYLRSRDVRLWLDGGWAVDALLGEQTRSHNDVDLAVELADRAEYEAAVADAGYKFLYYDPANDAKDGTHLNWVVRDSVGRELDVHIVDTSTTQTLNDGTEVYGAMPYPVGSLDGVGTIDGVEVSCIAPEFLVAFHTGYELSDKDFHDVSALCARFDIELPPEYRSHA